MCVTQPSRLQQHSSWVFLRLGKEIQSLWKLVSSMYLLVIVKAPYLDHLLGKNVVFHDNWTWKGNNNHEKFITELVYLCKSIISTKTIIQGHSLSGQSSHVFSWHVMEVTITTQAIKEVMRKCKWIGHIYSSLTMLLMVSL